MTGRKQWDFGAVVNFCGFVELWRHHGRFGQKNGKNKFE